MPFFIKKNAIEIFFVCRLRKKLNILWHTILSATFLSFSFQSKTNETEAKDKKSLGFIQVEE